MRLLSIDWRSENEHLTSPRLVETLQETLGMGEIHMQTQMHLVLYSKDLGLYVTFNGWTGMTAGRRQ